MPESRELTMIEELIKKALEVRKNAYAPYSEFLVGAALEAKDGRIFTGCNIENAAYSPTNCGERTAFFKAVSEGVKEFGRIALVGGKKDSLVPITPCGVCLQVMMEFCDPDTFQVILATSETAYEIVTLAELLPRGFRL